MCFTALVSGPTVSEMSCAKALREGHTAHPLNHRSTRGGIFTASNGVPWELVWLLTLARNARTSLEMVDKFYASELSAEMNVRMLHSRRSSI
jgi:hypothetical protein